ncbi:MAG: SRPBCC domain-containing protein [Deltaproteobacteria bacterium]|nr:SRPBCC domain-containing protein [Deltaproteobacteria bacterium]
MSDPLVHDTLIVDRVYAAAPARVYAAWTDPALKARWFHGPTDQWTLVEAHMDVRVGGRERAVGRFASGTTTAFNALYLDVVKDQRLIYTYEMDVDSKRISYSLATIDIRPNGTGTRLIVTEQGVFFDGKDGAVSRKQGTEWLMDNLGASLGG